MRFGRSLALGAFAVSSLATACSGGGGNAPSQPIPVSPTTAPASGKPVATPTATPIGKAPTPTPTPVAHATPTGHPSATPTPTNAAIGFNDYTTFGYDDQHDVYNPNTTALTPATVSNVHLAWQVSKDYNTQTQPIIATGIPGHAAVVFVGGGSGYVGAYDALTGASLWYTGTGQEQYTCTNPNSSSGATNPAYFGVGGSVAYDPGSKSLYAVGNTNTSPNAPGTNTLYHLDGASGSIVGSVAFASPDPSAPSLDFAHTSVTLGANGLAYVGTSATCDISSWRGRVAAVSVPSMSLASTFYTTWNPSRNMPWGGGGIWGWGGVSLDFNGNVLTGVGNADNGVSEYGRIVAPFTPAPNEYSAYGDSIVRLAPDLSAVQAVDHPVPVATFNAGPAVDLDVNGTPVVYRPTGGVCDPQAAVQGKSGALLLYDETSIGSGPIASLQLAPSTYADGFLGSPAFSPLTGLLYVAVPSSGGSLYPPGMIAINPGCGQPSVAWQVAFGPDSYASGSENSPGVPRSVPAVSAGGVVLVGTMCVVSGDTCAPTPAASNVSRKRATSTDRKPTICCAPPGTEGGAVWALDATTGAVLNGGNPILLTSGLLRMPPTIDGRWIYVIDNDGDLYGLTLDPSYPAIQSTYHRPNARQARSLTIRQR